MTILAWMLGSRWNFLPKYILTINLIWVCVMRSILVKLELEEGLQTKGRHYVAFSCVFASVQTVASNFLYQTLINNSIYLSAMAFYYYRETQGTLMIRLLIGAVYFATIMSIGLWLHLRYATE